MGSELTSERERGGGGGVFISVKRDRCAYYQSDENKEVFIFIFKFLVALYFIDVALYTGEEPVRETCCSATFFPVAYSNLLDGNA